ncbi:MAG: ABC transporter substrate-binding protein [Cellulomonadaceae bacterium]|jgi:raffinose/stachyose/melibiose transport system substrate-binding protein|nr:ABC transporter substrate-binding protein [Cellulomonadaceae bacterium]
MRKTLVSLAAVALALGSLAACGGGDSGNGGGDATDGSVYFLNFKPEVADVWTKIAAAYTAETGTPVKVETAAAGTYETKLETEMAGNTPPTIFQINGPVGYASWSDYTADLTDSWLYKNLSDQGLAIKDDSGVYGIPYAVEAYGIIYNAAIFNKYIEAGNPAGGITAVTDIKDFATLKAVTEDMQSKKADLGIDGVFSATSLKPGEDWRWQTHLANVPFHFEWTKGNVNLGEGVPAEVKFEYNPNYKDLFDLYLNNSTVPKEQLGAKTVDESMAEFASGKTAMVQNGTWGWAQVSGTDGNVVKPEDVGFLPLYMGIEDDSQGICAGTENFWSINVEASDADQAASLAFLEWVLSSDAGKKFVMDDLGFVMPFTSFSADELPADPLVQSMNALMTDDALKTVPWDFTVFPSQAFKDDFGSDLLQYAQGQMEWPAVVTNVVAKWKSEAALLQ